VPVSTGALSALAGRKFLDKVKSQGFKYDRITYCQAVTPRPTEIVIGMMAWFADSASPTRFDGLYRHPGSVHLCSERPRQE
jgi:hypothetical protein